MVMSSIIIFLIDCYTCCFRCVFAVVFVVVVIIVVVVAPVLQFLLLCTASSPECTNFVVVRVEALQ